MSEWIDIISNIGVPCAMCAVMFVYIKNLTTQMFAMQDKFTKSIDKLSDKIDQLLRG